MGAAIVSGYRARLVNAGGQPYDEIDRSADFGKTAVNRQRVILCERTRSWAGALARHLPSGVRMRQTRGLGECAAELADAPSSLVALELTRQNFSGVLRLVSELGRKHPVARAIVLAERGLEDYEWLLREAGAIHFMSSPRELAGLERLVRNHFRRLPVIPTTLAAQVWETLPWSEATSA